MTWEIPLLALIGFAGAFVFGVTGFGIALVTIPLATHFVPLEFALALFALMDLSCAAAVGLENPRNAVREEWKRLVPTILVGTAIGVTLLVNLPRQAGLFLLGSFVLLFSLYNFLKPKQAAIVSVRWAWLAGLGGGITSSVFGAGGPPYVIYLSQRGLTKEQFRATLGLTTLTSISTRVVAFLITGLLLDLRVWIAAAFVIPAALTAIWIARKVYLRISRELLMRAVAVMLLASGTSLILRALAQG
jgi:uncharacterized membrane protein YfcA